MSGSGQQLELTQVNVVSSDNATLKQVTMDIQVILTKVHSHEVLLNQLVKNQKRRPRPLETDRENDLGYCIMCAIIAMLLSALAALCMGTTAKEENYWRIYGPIGLGLLALISLLHYLFQMVNWTSVSVTCIKDCAKACDLPLPK